MTLGLITQENEGKIKIDWKIYLYNIQIKYMAAELPSVVLLLRLNL